MSIVDDTKKFEDWLRLRCHVVEEGLLKKHDLMARDQFKFFRSTCYRFARKTRELLPDLGNARPVPSVGDAHVENWGTWRDDEGRLVWGVNDFDDSALLPYTYDLLRLATSAQLSGQVSGSPKDQVATILNGYNDGLSKPGPGFIDVDVPWMADLARHLAPVPSKFKKKLENAKTANPPAEVTEALLDQLPSGAKLIAYHKWQKGEAPWVGRVTWRTPSGAADWWRAKQRPLCRPHGILTRASRKRRPSSSMLRLDDTDPRIPS